MSDEHNPPMPPRIAVRPPPVGHERVRLLLAYDGSKFSGYAQNENVRTVAGELRAALERVLRRQVFLAVAGRTDAGVHAWGQVVSFDAPIGIVDPPKMRRTLNSLLGPTIATREVTIAPDDFHARFSAVGRTYHYKVLCAQPPDPFLAKTSWHMRSPVDLPLMSAASNAILGLHHFGSFCKIPRDRPGATMLRRVDVARWTETPHPDGRVLDFEITASAFCHQMVRSLVGTLMEIGLAKMDPGELETALTRDDRSLAGPLAPPEGLTLWKVHY